nr:hypothetical protein [Candidatus Sigynarchaeota archaeon]
MTEREPSKMTRSVLINAAIVEKDRVAIPSWCFENLDGDHLLFMYIKSKKILQVKALKNMKHHDLAILTLFSNSTDLLQLVLAMSQSVFKDKEIDLIWSGGVCPPDEESRERIGIKDGCVWEGVIQVPFDLTPAMIETKLKKLDKDSVLSRIDVKIVEMQR